MKIGLVAGSGRFPLLVLEEAKRQELGLCVCAIRGEADEILSRGVPEFQWVRVGELGKVIRFFKENRVTEALLAGKVRKVSIFSGNVRPDLEMIKALRGTRDLKDQSLLTAIVRHLEKKGVRVLKSTEFLSQATVGPGILTRRRPNRREREDIEFGWSIAKEIARLDIGQSVVVREKAVLAVEAIEGTDEAIRRGGRLGAEAVVVKVARPQQDLRFDVPCVGCDTVQVMSEVGAKVLAVEAGRTLLLDKRKMLDEADRREISVVAR